jgi:hypothetical protein
LNLLHQPTVTTVAAQSVKLIIQQQHLPVEQQSIKPLDVGGIAGGTKYANADIFFKFATDNQGLYGGDRYAAKVSDNSKRESGETQREREREREIGESGERAGSVGIW